jgi:hydroxylamine dehydrogenase
MNRAYSKIMDYDTQIRERAALQKKIATLESRNRLALFALDSLAARLSLGGGMVLAGSLALFGWQRRKRQE